MKTSRYGLYTTGSAGAMALLVLASCAGGGGGIAGGGTNSGTCGKDDDALFFSNLHGVDLMATITYPDGTFCNQQLDSMFSSVTRTNASFVEGEVYGFSLSATDPALIIPDPITCTVTADAVTNGAATIEVQLGQPNLDNRLRLRCAGNWVEG